MLALLGAIIAAISPILPWATIQFNPITIPGSYPSYQPQNLILPMLNIPASGFETIIYPTFSGFFLVVLSIALFANDERRRTARGLFIATGGFIMLMTYVYAISAAIMAKDTVHDYYLIYASLLKIELPQNYWPNVSIAIEAYVALFGALITIAAGLWALKEKSTSENAPPPGPEH
jgi:heme O synthase-like polyprenyltransferase